MSHQVLLTFPDALYALTQLDTQLLSLRTNITCSNTPSTYGYGVFGATPRFSPVLHQVNLHIHTHIHYKYTPHVHI
nr:MAG TPA_asm: hypothetical protein [Caudoviricetes sp.]